MASCSGRSQRVACRRHWPTSSASRIPSVHRAISANWSAVRGCSTCRTWPEISAGEADPLTRPGTLRGRAFVELGNARTGLFLALRQENVLRGILWFYRQEVRPFSEKQIALAAQLRRPGGDCDGERAADDRDARGARSSRTATAEVLQVINSSPGDLAPVFDAVLEKATSVVRRRIRHSVDL